MNRQQGRFVKATGPAHDQAIEPAAPETFDSAFEAAIAAVVDAPTVDQALDAAEEVNRLGAILDATEPRRPAVVEPAGTDERPPCPRCGTVNGVFVKDGITGQRVCMRCARGSRVTLGRPLTPTGQRLIRPGYTAPEPVGKRYIDPDMPAIE